MQLAQLVHVAGHTLVYSLPALHEKEEDETDGHQNYEMPRSEILVINHPIWYLLCALKLFYAKDNTDSSSLFVLSGRVRVDYFRSFIKNLFWFYLLSDRFTQ